MRRSSQFSPRDTPQRASATTRRSSQFSPRDLRSQMTHIVSYRSQSRRSCQAIQEDESPRTSVSSDQSAYCPPLQHASPPRRASTAQRHSFSASRQASLPPISQPRSVSTRDAYREFTVDSQHDSLRRHTAAVSSRRVTSRHTYAQPSRLPDIPSSGATTPREGAAAPYARAPPLSRRPQHGGGASQHGGRARSGVPR